MRLALLGVFLVGAVKTFEAEQNSIRRGFIGRLVVLGSMWFAAMPVLVLVAMVCAEYVQEPVSDVFFWGGGHTRVGKGRRLALLVYLLPCWLAVCFVSSFPRKLLKPSITTSSTSMFI